MKLSTSLFVLSVAMIFSRATSFIRAGAWNGKRSLSMMSSAQAELKTLTQKYVDLGVVEKSFKNWREVFTEDAVFIRPTGNPMGMKMYEAMMGSEDVKVTSNELLSIDRIDVCDGGVMGYVMYTAHSKFSFKGTPNDDIAVFCMIAKKIDGEWRFVGGSRSNGRSPEEPKPDFNVE